MDDVAIPRRGAHIAAHGAEQILNFIAVDRHILGASLVGNIGRADQRQIASVRIDEDDAPVVVLEQIGMGAGPEFRHHHMAALDEPHAMGGVQARDAPQDVVDPGSRRVDNHTGAHHMREAVSALHLQLPGVSVPLRPRCGGPRQHARAEARGIHQIQNHETRVVDPAIGIFEPATKLRSQRSAFGSTRKIEAAARR